MISPRCTVTTAVAALGVLVLLPSSAAAITCPPPPLPQFGEAYGEEATAEEKVEEAHSKEVWACEKEAPASFLEVAVGSQHGSTYRHPGRTVIVVVTAPDPNVTLTGVKESEQAEDQADAIETKWINKGLEKEGKEHNAFVILWSCRHPRKAIHYTVTAQGGSGPPLTHTGAFTIPLSARWCAAAQQQEHRQARENAQERAQERKEAHEQAEREAEAQQREHEQWEANCRKLGGTVVQLPVGSAGAVETVCRGPNGGIIEVPG